MPLERGSSAAVRSHNIAEMIRAGHPPAQAEAAAYRESGEGRDARDMERAEWSMLKRLLVKFFGEEETEPSHAPGADSPSGRLSEKERAAASPPVEHREEMPESAFLEPGQRKYPVRIKRDGAWHYDRDLLLAAAREARMHGHEELAGRADAIRKREFGGADDAEPDRWVGAAGHKVTIEGGGPELHQAVADCLDKWGDEFPKAAGVKRVTFEHQPLDKAGRHLAADARGSANPQGWAPRNSDRVSLSDSMDAAAVPRVLSHEIGHQYIERNEALRAALKKAPADDTAGHDGETKSRYRYFGDNDDEGSAEAVSAALLPGDDVVGFAKAFPAMVKAAKDHFSGRASDMALDRDPSNRHIDEDGRLHVDDSNVAKAKVDEYYGEEIPNWEKLGLEPRRKYKMLRDPKELEKAAPTFKGVPILSKHKPTSAADHPKDLTIGAVAGDARWEEPYLKADLVFWPLEDIDKILSDEKKELSPSYHYVPDMTPGKYEGEPYDGVMRDIVFNHLGHVEKGRQGGDVSVNDSAESSEMPTPTLSTGALILKSALFVKYPKLLAMDAQLTDMVKDITGKKFREQKRALAPALHGLLGADATLEHMHGFLDSLDEPEEDASELEASGGIPMAHEPAPADRARRAEDARRRLGRDETEEERKEREEREREEDAEDAAWARRAEDARRKLGRDETEEEREEREERESAEDARRSLGRDERPEEAEDRRVMDRMSRDRRRAEDLRRRAEDARKRANDRKRAARDNPPPFKGMPEPGGQMVDRKTMDEAIREAVQGEQRKQAAIHAAVRYVQPWTGAMDGAFSSEEQVYGKALQILGVRTDGMPAVAYRHVLDATPKPGARSTQLALDSRLPTDSSGAAGFFELFPDAKNIRVSA